MAAPVRAKLLTMMVILFGAQSGEGIGSAQVVVRLPVMQVDGQPYVNLDSLVQASGAAVVREGDQAKLTFPEPGGAKLAFSKDFLRSAIEALTAIREWRIAVVSAIQNNQPLSAEWVGNYSRNAEDKVALTSATAGKAPDKDFVPLLGTELANMRKLSDQYLGLRQSLTYVAPDALSNDPLDKQVLDCARGLIGVATSGQFQDVPVCH